MRRDNKGKWAVALALILIAIAGAWVIHSVSGRRVTISMNSTTVQAQVADTDDLRQKGLSGTSQLGENQAMLFVFEVPARWGIWMKDMKYNLDILWLDSDKKVVYMEQNVAPGTYPKVFLPDHDALYVVELPAGFIAKHSVGVGQTLTFSGY